MTKKYHYRFGHVTPWWDDDHYKTLDYKYFPIRNQQDLVDWGEAGFGRLDLNGAVYNMKRELPDYANGFFELFDWDHQGLTFYRLKPWEGLPTHQDAYTSYREMFNITDPSLLWRCVVFMEDWKSGHYFDIDDQAFMNWRKGDYVVWNYDVPHYAANFGTENRYTLQITGTQKR
jgi:hypothetical protein